MTSVPVPISPQTRSRLQIPTLGNFLKSPYSHRRALLTRFSFRPINLSSRQFKALLGAFSCVWRDSTGKAAVGSWGFVFSRGRIRAPIRRGMGKWPIRAGARRTLHSAGGGAGGASRRIPFARGAGKEPGEGAPSCCPSGPSVARSVGGGWTGMGQG